MLNNNQIKTLIMNTREEERVFSACNQSKSNKLKKILQTFALVSIVVPTVIMAACEPVMTPLMIPGDRTHVDVSDRTAVLAMDYTQRGTDILPVPSEVELAKVSEVGTTWATAFNQNTRKYYVAAFLRRHADISPDGLGAIYEIDVTDVSSAATVGTPSLWMDLNSLTHLGAGATLFPTDPGAAARNLAGPADPSHDVWSYSRVGKQGIAGLELSDDHSTMYAVDMTNRQLLVIDTATKSVTNRHAITDPGCDGGAGDVRHLVWII